MLKHLAIFASIFMVRPSNAIVLVSFRGLGVSKCYAKISEVSRLNIAMTSRSLRAGVSVIGSLFRAIAPCMSVATRALRCMTGRTLTISSSADGLLLSESLAIPSSLCMDWSDLTSQDTEHLRSPALMELDALAEVSLLGCIWACSCGFHRLLHPHIAVRHALL